MSIALVGSVGSNRVTTGTTVTGTYGQTPTAKNLLIAIVAGGGTTATEYTVTCSGGWTDILGGQVDNNSDGTDNAGVSIWFKQATGSETNGDTTWTVGVGGTEAMVVAILELSGANTAQPLSVQGGYISGPTAATITSAAITSLSKVVSASEFAISVISRQRGTAGTTTFGRSASWTNAYNDGATSSRVHVSVDYLSGLTAGSTVSNTPTLSGSGTSSMAAGAIISIVPAGDIRAADYGAGAETRQKVPQTTPPQYAKLFLPMYIYPSPATPFTTADSLAPTTKYIVMNPASGPGSTADANYTSAISNARSSGVTVLGYVNLGRVVGWPNASLAQVQYDVANWNTIYGVTDIFFDLAQSSRSDLDHHVAAAALVSGTSAFNFGAVPDRDYVSALPQRALMCIWENLYASWSGFVAPDWLTHYDPQRFIVLTYNAATIAEAEAIIEQAVFSGVGLFDITDEADGNWTALPTYLSTEAAYLAALYPVVDSDAGTGTDTGSIPGGPTAVSSSDSGTGSETQGLGIALTDSGTGSDAGLVTASLASTDAGSGVDVQGLGVALADAGAGAETQQLVAQIAAADTGTGSEVSFTGVTGQDSGSGSDSQGLTISQLDSGSGSDRQGGTGVALADAGSGAEAQSVLVFLASQDTGTGQETQQVVVSLSSQDTGSGTENQQASSPFKNDSDAGTGAEIWLVTAALAGTDAGTGAEAQQPGIASTDAGTGSEAQTPTARTAVADGGAGAETQGLALASQDAGTGAEVQGVTATAQDADAGSGTDAAVLAILAADAGTGAESGAITTEYVGSAETGTGAESYPGFAAITPIDPPDTATGAEAQAATAFIAGQDAGTGTDTGGGSFTSHAVADSDAGRGQEGDQEPAAGTDAATGAEAGVVVLMLVSGADTGSGTETGTVFQAIFTPASADSGTGSESWFTAAAKTDADASTGADGQALLYAPADQDVSTGTDELYYSIDVYPFPPPWLYQSPQGGYRLIWKPGTADERVVREFVRLEPWVWEYEQTIRYSATLLNVGDVDAGAAAEANGPTATVYQYATAALAQCEAGALCL